jgi:hypothetical protein
LGFVTNITDYFKCAIWKAAVPVVLCGIIISCAFTSNVGWIIFDMTEYYILRYIVISVGLLQCVSVGWFFEYFTTSRMSLLHAKSLRILAVCYWLPVVVICFYSNFGLESNKMFGLVFCSIFVCLALVLSFLASQMEFNSWYHEIVL